MRCTECGTKNKIPADKITGGSVQNALHRVRDEK
jgi:hypothetical protein